MLMVVVEVLLLLMLLETLNLMMLLSGDVGGGIGRASGSRAQGRILLGSI